MTWPYVSLVKEILHRAAKYYFNVLKELLPEIIALRYWQSVFPLLLQSHPLLSYVSIEFLTSDLRSAHVGGGWRILMLPLPSSFAIHLIFYEWFSSSLVCLGLKAYLKAPCGLKILEVWCDRLTYSLNSRIQWQRNLVTHHRSLRLLRLRW